MIGEADIDWIRIALLGFSAFFAVIAIIIRYWWKHLHKWVPQLPRTKKWPNYLIAFFQLAIFLVLVIGTRNYWYSDVNENASDFYKMSEFATGLEAKLTSTDKMLADIHFPKQFEIMKAEFPVKLFEIEARSTILKKINMGELDKFEKWLKNNTCAGSEIDELIRMRSVEMNTFKEDMQDHTIFNNVKSNWTDVARELRFDADDREMLNEEKRNFEGHVSRTRKMLGRLSYIWENAEGFFRSGMMKSTEIKNFSLFKIYASPGILSMYFAFWSVVCTFFFTQFQLDGYWVSLMKTLFYLNAFQAIVLSGHELHTILAPNCNPIIADYGLFQFEIPFYETQSTIKAQIPFMTCISNGGKLFSDPNKIIEASESNFTENFSTKLKDQSTGVFKEIKRLDEDVFKPKPMLNKIVGLVSKVHENCPNSAEFLKPVFDIKNNFDHYEHIANLSGTIQDMKDDSFDAPMRRMGEFINAPVHEFNNIMQGTNFDCREHYEAYLHGYNWFCTAVNHVVIDHLKIAIIVCSSLLSVLHLFYFRRSDNTQYWNDPRVRWAHKFMTDFVDDEQYKEWLTINNEDPPEATYYEFSRRKNRKRNRFSDVPLIDQSRVVLTNHVTDYIHASWIPVPGTSRKYIATQAPKPKTFKDFWAMVLQEKAKIVIQLCGFIELDHRICDLYFPFYVGETVRYHNLQVTCTNIEKPPKSSGLWKTTKRTFELVDLKHPDSPPHVFSHIFFKSWYIEVVPIGLMRVVDLQRYVESLVEDNSPIVVLDHSGIDRTGVYITMDYAHSLIVQDRFETMVDVVNTIATMRWGIFPTYIPYFFIFASLTHRFISENYLFEEDWRIPMWKYRKALNNRIGAQHTWRGNKQVEIHYWKDRDDPSWWKEK